MNVMQTQQYYNHLLKDIVNVAQKENVLVKIPKQDLHWMVKDLADADVVWPLEEIPSKPLIVVYIKSRPVIVDGISRYIKSLRDNTVTVDAYVVNEEFYFNYINQVH